MTDDSSPDGGLDGFARLRRRALVVYGLIALALIPWTAHLSSSLPSRHQTAHWDVLWAGFDLGLLAAFAGTGTLLLCDAWFDLLTSRPGSERLWASIEALLGELPLAVFSFWVAYDAEKVHASTRRYVTARRLRREAGATAE
jgi:hypothetical protein